MEDFAIESLGESLTTQTRRRSSLFNKLSNGKPYAMDSYDSINAGSDMTSPVPPIGSRHRRLATWADDTDNDIQQLRSVQSTANKHKLLDNNDDDVTPIIPELQEVNDYEMTQQVAKAPVAYNQVIKFQELDKNLLKQSAFTSLDGIDLTQLTHYCLPESQVKEDDIPWSWDHLMSDVTSRLMTTTENTIN